MKKIIVKNKNKFIVLLIVVILLITEHLVHSAMRSSNYWAASYEEELLKPNAIKTYNENELTQEEFDKLFYGDESESEEK